MSLPEESVGLTFVAVEHDVFLAAVRGSPKSKHAQQGMASNDNHSKTMQESYEGNARLQLLKSRQGYRKAA